MKSVDRFVLAVAIAAWSTAAFAQTPAKSGVLLLAHGGSAEWNERVAEVVKAVDGSMPTEVAFGMASRASIQSAVDKLAARGVTEIVAVPLFVSSHSSVITSTEFLLGLRKEAPKDLAIFAKMNHRSHGAPAADHAAHHGPPAADPASPVTTTLKIRMTPALNRHPLIGAIVADRAKSISKAPENEAVILVAHGPVPDDDNRRWLEDMEALHQRLERLLAAIAGELPAGALCAVEVRDPEWLTPAFARLLTAQGARYCLGLHDRMPPIAGQLPMLRAQWPGPLVCRWNLQRGLAYEQARNLFKPFDRLAAPDPVTRQALARVMAATAQAGHPVFVAINNKAEGSAPLSVIELAREVCAPSSASGG